VGVEINTVDGLGLGKHADNRPEIHDISTEEIEYSSSLLLLSLMGWQFNQHTGWIGRFRWLADAGYV